MSTGTGRFIGGEHHGEPFRLPLSADHMAIINTGSKYSSFIAAHPLLKKPLTYLVSTELLDEPRNLSERAIAFIREKELWDWGAA